MSYKDNPYKPFIATVKEAWYETTGDRCIKTMIVILDDKKIRDKWQHRPGQCAMVGVLGEGESMLSISNSPTEGKFLRFSIMLIGKVTEALHNLEPGDKLTVRGPYGNSFPVEEWKGKDIVTIGGGIGQAPLRPVIEYIKAHRKDYGKLTVIYGARTSNDLCFTDELDELNQCSETSCYKSIDVAEEGWNEYVGFVPSLLMEVRPAEKNTIAITCGPPIMIKFVLERLKELNFKDHQIYTTLENRMKCGVGKCGRCNVGNLYVCKEGPVFSYKTLKNIPEAFA